MAAKEEILGSDGTRRPPHGETNAKQIDNRLKEYLEQGEHPAIIAHQSAHGTGVPRSNFCGGQDGDDYKVLVAQQRGWDYTTADCEDLDDDAGGLNANGQPNRSRIWIYDPDADSWDHIAWALAPVPENASWVGLSEITAAPDGSWVVLERDNHTGGFARLKSLVNVDLDDELVSAGDKSVYDMLPDLKATNGWITDKPEGVAILPNGKTFVVTDNDGVDDWSGETWFLPLGDYNDLF